MDQNLRSLFEQALDGEPVPPPGDLAGAAMAQGARLRRRRHLIGSAAAVLSLAGAAAGASILADPAPPPTAAATCVSAAADGTAAEVSVFLDMEVTDAQRSALATALRHDPRVLTYRYETPEQAYQKFEELWRDQPRPFGSVSPEMLPPSFRIELIDPSEYASFRADLHRLGGVTDIFGRTCR